MNMWRRASLQELMLYLHLRKASLNKEVQILALLVQHFAYIKHNDRCCSELVAVIIEITLTM